MFESNTPQRIATQGKQADPAQAETDQSFESAIEQRFRDLLAKQRERSLAFVRAIGGCGRAIHGGEPAGAAAPAAVPESIPQAGVTQTGSG